MNYLIKRGVSRNFKFQELTNAMRIRKFNEMCNLSYYSILQQFLNLSQSTENWFVLRVLTVLKLIWFSNSWSVSLYCIESIKYCFLYMHSDDVILLIVWEKMVYTFIPGATFSLLWCIDHNLRPWNCSGKPKVHFSKGSARIIVKFDEKGLNHACEVDKKVTNDKPNTKKLVLLLNATYFYKWHLNH